MSCLLGILDSKLLHPCGQLGQFTSNASKSILLRHGVPVRNCEAKLTARGKPEHSRALVVVVAEENVFMVVVVVIVVVVVADDNLGHPGKGRQVDQNQGWTSHRGPLGFLQQTK